MKKWEQKALGLIAVCFMAGSIPSWNKIGITYEVKAETTNVAPEATTFKKISAGAYHSMAIDSYGNLWTWGQNTYGQLGDGTTNYSATPIHIMPGTKFIDCSAGYYHSLAISSDGSLYGWGSEPQYTRTLLGKASKTPVLLDSANKYVQCTAQYNSSFVLTTSGVGKMWGVLFGSNKDIDISNIKKVGGFFYSFLTNYSSGVYGDCGMYINSSNTAVSLNSNVYQGSYNESTTFATANVQQIAGVSVKGSNDSGSKNSVLLLDGNGVIYLYTSVDQTGVMSSESTTDSPICLFGSQKFSAIDISKGYCPSLNVLLSTGYAIDSSGLLYSWGYNGSFNMLGYSGATTTPAISPVSSTLKFSAVSAGAEHVLALDPSGHLYAWGNNADGRLGIPTTTASSETPLKVSLTNNVLQYSFLANVGKTYSGILTSSSGSGFALVTTPTKGTFAFDAADDGSFTYIPNSDAHGQDFAKVSFVSGGSTYTYNINITINRTPSFGVSVLSVTTPQNTAYSSQLFGLDGDGDTLSFGISSQPSKGTMVIDSATGSYTYTPFAGAAGNDSCVVSVSDGFEVVTATLTIHIESEIQTTDKTTINIDNTSDTSYSGNIGATDADGDTLAYSVSTSPSLGTLSLGASGEYTYTPTSGVAGTDSFTIQVTDGVKPVALVYTVNVYKIKDGGTKTDYVIARESTLNGEIKTESQNVTLAYSIKTASSKGSVNIDASTGKFVYTGSAGFVGSDSFVVTVDYGYGSYEKTINVFLDTEPNITAVVDHITTNQNTSYVGTAQSTDVDGDTLAYSVFENPTKGSLSVNEHTGSYTYVPNASAAGSDQFTISVTDGTMTQKIVIYVHIESQITTETALSIVVSQNDTYSGTISAVDPDGDVLTYSIQTPAVHGVATVNTSTGEYAYVPTANYFGSDSFVIRVTDGVTPKDITISVKVNQAPTTANPTISLTATGKPVSGNANCSDADGDTLTYTITSNPTKGTVLLDSATGNYVYTPNANAAGNDAFSITASDGQDQVVVKVVVHNETEIDVSGNQTSLTVNQGKQTIGQAQASDADGDTLSYSVGTQPTKGTLILNAVTGAWTYQCNSDAKGSDTFSIIVTDGITPKTISYTLQINTPPVFASESSTSVTTDQGKTYSGSVSASDADGDPLVYSVVSQGNKGTVAINASTGKYTYVPNSGAAGGDYFVIGVSDGNFTQELHVSIHIETPVTTSEATQNTEVNQGDITYGSVTASDPDGDILSYSVSQHGAKGTAAISSDGHWSYFANGSAGNDVFVIAVTDGNNTVYVTVYVHINSDPAFSTDSETVNVAHGGTVEGDATASDSDGDTLTYSISTSPSDGVVNINTTSGHFTYAANPSSTASSDSFIVKVTDGKTAKYLTIHVTINNAPTAQNVSIDVAQGGSAGGTITASDPEGDVLGYTIGSQGSKGTATINSTSGAFEYVANHDATGEDIFTVVIGDGVNKTTISVHVNIKQNVAPTAQNSTITVSNGGSASGKVDVTDPNGLPLTFAVGQQGSKGTATINETTGEYVYKANFNASGNDTFSVTISNGYSTTTTTVTVNINTTAATAAIGAVALVGYTAAVVGVVVLIMKASKKHLDGAAK
jgi:VCBS repeat-containing protein